MKKIICTLLLVLLSLTLFGCEALGIDPSAAVKGYVEEYLEEKKITAEKGIADILENASNVLFAGDKALEEEFYSMLADFDYEIGDINITEDGAKVGLTITTYDFRTFIANYVTSYISNALTLAISGADKDEFIKKSAEVLKEQLADTKKTGKTVSTELTLIITIDEEGNYVLDAESNGDAITNAVLGGLVELFNNYANDVLPSDTDSEK